MNVTALKHFTKAVAIIAAGLSLVGIPSARAEETGTPEPSVVQFGKFLTNKDQIVLRGFAGTLKDVKVLCGLMGGEYAGKRCFTGNPYQEEWSEDGKRYECQLQSWCGSTEYLRGAYVILTQADNGDVSIRCEWVRYRKASDGAAFGDDMRAKGSYSGTWAPGASWTTGGYTAGFVHLGLHGGTMPAIETLDDTYAGERTIRKAELKTVPYQRLERLFRNTRLSDVIGIRATACMVYNNNRPLIKTDTSKVVPADVKPEGYAGNEGFYFVERDETYMTFQVQVADGVNYSSANPLRGGMFVELVQQGNDIYGQVYDARYIYHEGTYGDDYRNIASQRKTYYCTDEEDETTMTESGGYGVIRLSLRDLRLMTKGRDETSPADAELIHFSDFISSGKTVATWLPGNLANFHALRCSVGGAKVTQKGKFKAVYEGLAYNEHYDDANNVYTCQMQMRNPDCDSYLRGIGLTFTQAANGDVTATVDWVRYISNGTPGDDFSKGSKNDLATSHTGSGYAFSDFVFSYFPSEDVVDAPITAYEGNITVKECEVKTVPLKEYGLLFRNTRLADVIGLEATSCMTFQQNGFTPATMIAIDHIFTEADAGNYGPGFYFVERKVYGNAAHMTFQVQGDYPYTFNPPLMGGMFVDLVQIGDDIYGQVVNARYIYNEAVYGADFRNTVWKNKVQYYLDGEDETLNGDDYGVMRFSLRDLKLKVPYQEPDFAGVDWIGGATGDWDDPNNWSTYEVPTKGDSVRIYNGGESVAITMSAGATEIQSISIRTDTTLTGAGTFANLAIKDDKTLTLNLTGDSTLKSVTGGTLVKEGTAALEAVDGTDGSTLSGTKVIINEGRIRFNSGHLTDPSFVIGENGELENYGWFTVNGTLTIENETEKEIFSNYGATGDNYHNAYLQGDPKIIKNGAGILTLHAGLQGQTSPITINAGRLVFGSNRGIEYKGVISGEGAAGLNARELNTTFTFSGLNKFTGGFYIVRGVAKAGSGTAFGPYSTDPAESSNIYVMKDGTLDINNAQDKTYNIYTEGILQSSAARDPNCRQLADIVLTGDTTVRKKRFGLLGPNYGPTRLTLGDHTLTIDMDDSEGFYIGNTTISGAGTIDVTNGYLNVAKPSSKASDATIIIRSGAKLILPYALTVKNLVLEEGALFDLGDNKDVMLTVTGAYTPGAAPVNLTLADTATLRFPAGFRPSESMTLCTGTLTVAEGFRKNGASFYVGDELKTGNLVIDGNKISYQGPGFFIFVK